ncbi:hypothetical protein BGX21_003990 [Mortierella sp. AD011]|nr:hypothetical protein BGX21_003990 [Mortierella sp. AD011]
MLTSPPIAEKTAVSASSAHVHNVTCSHCRLSEQHDRCQDHVSVPLLPQPQHQPQQPYSHSEATHTPSQDLTLSHISEVSGAFSEPTSPLPSSIPSTAQQEKRQSRLNYYRPSDFDTQASLDRLSPSTPILDIQESNGTQEISTDKNEERLQGQKFVVRLDLRKLGTGIHDIKSSKKASLRQHPKQKSARNTTAYPNHSPAIQTTLSASSWSLAKPAPGPPDIYDTPKGTNSTTTHTIHIPSSIAGCAASVQTPDTAPNDRLPSTGRQLRRKSVTPEVNHTFSYDGCFDSRSDGDEDYVDRGSQAVKRRNSSRVLRNPTSNKRIRTPDQGAAKKKRVDEDARKQRQEVAAVKKLSPKKPAKSLMLNQDIVSITGDEHSLKFNNDYCEACIGLGEFICCDSCPKAFHFSCCQPPLDPSSLPDEWLCNECYAAKNPPSSAHAVVAGTDGEYEDVADHKPKAKRNSSTTATGTISRAEEDALQPRRRKRRDAVPVQLNDPGTPNDGSIEVIPDPEPTMRRGPLWDTDTSGILYRVPERSIKLSFIEKCQKKSIMEARLNQLAFVESHMPESSTWRFNLLVAAVMANEHQANLLPLSKPSGHNQGQNQNQITYENQDDQNVSQDNVQDGVLERLTNPAERQEYLRFKAFQQYVREHGVEEAMKQWLSYQEEEKERIASQGLLSL